MKTLTANKQRYTIFSILLVTILLSYARLEAEQRYREAMEEVVRVLYVLQLSRMLIQLSDTQALEAQCRNKPLVDRKKALDMEKERAKKVAGMPSPQSYDIVMVCVNKL